MIVIAEPYAQYRSTIAADDLEHAAANLLQFADQISRSHFADRYGQLDVTVVARVEVGSTRVWITIATLANALISYGGIRQSVDYLIKDGQYLGQLILAGVPESIGIQSRSSEREERRLGVPGQLQRLFSSVERGEISAAEATMRALTILQTQGGVYVMRELPKLTEQFVVEFKEAANSGRKQLSMNFGQAASPPDVPTERGKQKAHQREIALLPTTPRQRRRGVIASRNRTTGHAQISMY
jgi:hypothetical protein